jgi:hypothetical protein
MTARRGRNYSVRLISPHPNDVTDEGMKQSESMLEAAREAHATVPRWPSPRVICAIGAPGARPLVSFRALPIRREAFD